MFKSENTDLMLKRVGITVAEAALVNNLASSSGIRVILHLPTCGEIRPLLRNTVCLENKVFERSTWRWERKVSRPESPGSLTIGSFCCKL